MSRQKMSKKTSKKMFNRGKRINSENVKLHRGGTCL